MTSEQLEVLRAYIAAEVWEGYDSFDEIVQNAVEYAIEEAVPNPGELQAAAERLTREAFTAHFATQAAWDGPTDCDRLDQAFAALETAGIIARQDFSCCGNCGRAEIWDELPDEGAERYTGYTFFHLHSTESAVAGQGVCLIYGTFAAHYNEQDHIEAVEAVGQQVYDCLSGAGLRPAWSGSADDTVTVPMVWRRRRRQSKNRVIQLPLKPHEATPMDELNEALQQVVVQRHQQALAEQNLAQAGELVDLNAPARVTAYDLEDWPTPGTVLHETAQPDASEAAAVAFVMAQSLAGLHATGALPAAAPSKAEDEDQAEQPHLRNSDERDEG